MKKNLFLDKKWLNNHLDKATKKAGKRYSPELNVELPISEIFDGIGRTEMFYNRTREHYGKLKKRFRGVAGNYQKKELNQLYKKFSVKIEKVLSLLDAVKSYNLEFISWKSLLKNAEEASRIGWELSEGLRAEKKERERLETEFSKKDGFSQTDRLDFDAHNIYEMQSELRYFSSFSASKSATLSNTPYLLLMGLAGSGKTHLLCDVLKGRAEAGLPCVLTFGEFFNGHQGFWTQLKNQLELGADYDKEKILTALDNAGKLSGTRSLLMVDALNESRPINYWKSEIAKVYRDLKKYPNISLVLSVRQGYEKEVFPDRFLKLFPNEEHQGFQFREWEAVTKFFHEFSLPLPEIPLLLPEFQNPLFLLLFCSAFQNRVKTGKQIFRGHEGATYIFENFVKSIANRVAVKFGLPKGRSNGEYIIWDTVIKKVAEEMINKNTDRIAETDLTKVIGISHPTVPIGEFIDELEKNLLLVKVPIYDSSFENIIGFEFRFPFQKFSDHLLARYIFKKYMPLKGSKSPQQFFSKRTKIGKFIAKSYNRGVIEALSIQSPENLDGMEFFEIAPYLSEDLLSDAVVQSIIWRTPNAFTDDKKSLLNFINQYIARTQSGNYDLLNAFLSVASVPEHPFNAEYLHRHLMKSSMARRDAIWTVFLHDESGAKGAVDRLREWASSSQAQGQINDRSIKLCAMALAWFLSSSNRFLRDSATKALINLLTRRLNMVTELLKDFRGVNDLYILERLYAVAYGCSLRNRTDRVGLKGLASLVYRDIFSCKNVVPHILLRDYAKGVIDLAVSAGVVKINPKKIAQPFKSQWPGIVPSVKSLKRKYYPDISKLKEGGDRKYLAIWSSVMHDAGSLADFGNYIVNSALGDWTGRRLKGKWVDRKKLFEDFKNKLTLIQKRKLNELRRELQSLRVLLSSRVATPEDVVKERRDLKKEKRKILKEFKNLLTVKKVKYFEKSIEPYLDDWGDISDSLDRFDTGLAQRWLFKRVIKLGWRPDLHGEFDRRVGQDDSSRSEHKAERLGKKYQWIAFHELLAFVADNFEFKESRYSNIPNAYSGAWQLIGVRDIDPTCVLPEAPSGKIDGIPCLSVLVPDYDDWMTGSSFPQWIKARRKMPDPKHLIEVYDNKGEGWLVLKSFVEWQEKTPPENEKYDIPTKTIWYMLNSYLVKEKEAEEVFLWAKEQDFYGRWMPESDDFYTPFLGEYPSAPAFLYEYIPFHHRDGWSEQRKSGKGKLPTKVLVTDDEYTSGGSSRDCSTSTARNIRLPAKWIIDEMSLSQNNTDGRFFDKKGDLVAFDPSVFNSEMNSCILIKKDELLKFLKRKKCAIIWTILGEKQTIGGSEMGQPYGWREFSGAYSLNRSGKVEGSIKSSFCKPTPQNPKKKPEKRSPLDRA